MAEEIEKTTPTSKQINNYISIFKNDIQFQTEMLANKIYLDNTDYISLANTLLEYKDFICSTAIDDLDTASFLRTEISFIYGKDYINEKTYKQTMYTFKYSAVKTFFSLNYKKFMPTYDYEQIQDSEKAKIFVEAFMKEFDRFSDIIESMYDAFDVDSVPLEYLNYLAQLVGYEREDSELLSNDAFRELIKNIVEVYKRKGSNYSFELFFSFLGFQVTIDEYWFDKRFYYLEQPKNPYTESDNRNEYSFYLTPLDPTTSIPENLSKKFVISKNSIIGTLDVNKFDKLISLGTYTPEQLLGIDPGYSDQTYTYFKTNVANFKLISIKTSEEIEEAGELTEEDNATILKYIGFLIPIFIQRNIAVTIRPYEESIANTLALYDTQVKQNIILNDFKTDNIIYGQLSDWIDSTEYSVDEKIKYGDLFYISLQDSNVGYYPDSEPTWWEETTNVSVYDKIRLEEPTFTDSQILDRIAKEIDSSAVHTKKDIDTLMSQVTAGFNKLKISFVETGVPEVIVEIVLPDAPTESQYLTAINNAINTKLGTTGYEYAYTIETGIEKRLIIRSEIKPRGISSAIIASYYDSQPNNISFLLFDDRFIRTISSLKYNPLSDLSKRAAGNYLFSTYLYNNQFIRKRDIFFPMAESYVIPVTSKSSDNLYTYGDVYFKTDMSYEIDNIKRLDNTRKIEDNLYTISKIEPSNKRIILSKTGKSITNKFRTGDKIIVKNSLHKKNNGKYTIKSFTETSSEITIIVDESMTGFVQNTSLGFAQVYFEQWKYNNSKFSFCYDKNIDIREV